MCEDDNLQYPPSVYEGLDEEEKEDKFWSKITLPGFPFDFS